MAAKESLIARKLAVRREIERVQREMAQARVSPHTEQRRIRRLETQLERLMAEESALRLEIDRSE